MEALHLPSKITVVQPESQKSVPEITQVLEGQ
jgi:hypothetical protein